MSKARTLADFISDGSEFADGTISVAEVSGAAPLASPSFTADASFEGGKIIINEVTGGDAYSEIRKTNTGSNFAIVSPEALYLLVDSNNDQTNRGVVIGHNAAAPGSATSLAVIAENGTVFNEAGADNDFRIESDTNAFAFVMDAGESKVKINTSTFGPSGAKNLVVGDGLVDQNTYTNGAWEKIAVFLPNDNGAGSDAGFVIGGASYGTSGTETLRLQFSNTHGNSGRPVGWHIRSYTNLDADNYDQSLVFDKVTRSGSGNPTVSPVFELNAFDTVFNQYGYSRDFRVESDLDTHMLFVDASTNRVGINRSSPNAPLHLQAGSSGGSLSDAFQISDSGYVNIAMYSGGADGEIRIGAAGTLRGVYKAQYAGTRSANDFSVGANNINAITFDSGGPVKVNAGGLSAVDFRVASDGNTHALFVDAGSGVVGINTSSTTASSRGDLALGGMMFFEPGGAAFNTGNPRPSLKRGGDGAFQIAAGSDSDSKLQFYTAASSGATLQERMQIDRNGVLFAPKTIRSYNNSSVYHSMHTDAVSLPNSTDTVVATLTKTGYAYYLAGEFRLVIYDSSSPWGVYNYKQTISGKTSTYTGGGMGVGLGTAEIVSRLDYTPTVSLVDNRSGSTGPQTWEIKVNPGTSGPASALTIFSGYMAGATWT